MGTKFSSISVSGFNASPPADDGSQVAANAVTWAKIKTKLADPLNTFAGSVNTALVTALDFSVRQVTAADNTVAGDHMKTMEVAPTVTSGITISLGDAAAMAAGYIVRVKNSSAVVCTVGRVTSGDTIDAVAGNLLLGPKQSVTLEVNAGANGYLILSRQSGPIHVQGADIASAATLDLDAATGDLVDVTTSASSITAITLSQGRERTVRFAGIVNLVHGASLVLPGAATIATAAGDFAVFRGYASGVVRCVDYTKADGTAVAGSSSAASTTVAGIVELLTQTEYDAGTDTTRAPTASLNKIALATAQATTSGTSIDFTSIPAGVRRITINFVGVSTSGTDAKLIQIGDSGGIENSGYLGGAHNFTSAANYTTGWGIISVSAANILHGSIVLTLENSAAFTWVAMGAIGYSDTTAMSLTAGSKSLSAELDRVRITTTGGANTFTAGAINITFER